MTLLQIELIGDVHYRSFRCKFTKNLLKFDVLLLRIMDHFLTLSCTSRQLLLLKDVNHQAALRGGGSRP